MTPAGLPHRSLRVRLQAVKVNPAENVIAGFIRMAFPFVFSVYLVQFAFRIGRKRKRDR
jgi:hypothetical protein